MFILKPSFCFHDLHSAFIYFVSQLLQLGSGCSDGLVHDNVPEKPTEGIVFVLHRPLRT